MDVAGIGHFANGCILSPLKGAVDRYLPGKRAGEQLANRRAEALVLGDGNELDADIGDRLDGGMGGVGAIDRSERYFREGCRLLIVGVVVERRARARRNVGPAVLRSNQRQIVLAGRPANELLGGIGLL